MFPLIKYFFVSKTGIVISWIFHNYAERWAKSKIFDYYSIWDMWTDHQWNLNHSKLYKLYFPEHIHLCDLFTRNPLIFILLARRYLKNRVFWHIFIAIQRNFLIFWANISQFRNICAHGLPGLHSQGTTLSKSTISFS